ncbi:TetR/AcrR family transcriptional regulator [Desulfosediminicola flagellatus]|uniref:TetR/AcrR family transcriptional regulator n=1 Tax=Desulfosediminicola flagellatus TaxID=2569541 RepID=UPI0010AD4F8C|nr:TetR/AcrR family transcriptional regulator [Desulfosediminicola flagellatus]
MSENRKSSSPLRVNPHAVLKIAKSERTRAAILNSALDFIWTHSFRDMTVKSLMASTGAGRSAFYQYFRDLHHLMESILVMLKEEIFNAAEPWVAGTGDPVALIDEAIRGLVEIAYERGPIYRAFTDAAATDGHSETAWNTFLNGFDNAATARIEADQEQGLIRSFDARPVAIALNRLDTYTLIEAFGQHPRRKPEPVRVALSHIWVSTLYGSEWLGSKSSSLVRK